MFRRLEPLGGAAVPAIARTVRITVDGAALDCRETDSVAAALFLAGLPACRDTAVSGTPRGPFCMMGVCYDCLVTVDGHANVQGCMTRVRDGMTVGRQAGARKVGA